MGEPTITNLAVDIAEIKRDLKTAFSRIDEQAEVSKNVQELVVEIKLQGQQLTNVVEKLTEMASEMKEIKSKPAKRWEAIVMQIISLIVVLVFGIVIAKIGL